MDIKKGSICLLKIGDNKVVPICIITKIDNKYGIMLGESTNRNFDNELLTTYFGKKYLSSKSDLINSSSWNDSSYNGVQYNLVMLHVDLVEKHSSFIKQIDINDFYPRGGKRNIKQLSEFNEIIEHQELSKFDSDEKWGYKRGFYDMLVNYKKNKD